MACLDIFSIFPVSSNSSGDCFWRWAFLHAALHSYFLLSWSSYFGSRWAVDTFTLWQPTNCRLRWQPHVLLSLPPAPARLRSITQCLVEAEGRAARQRRQTNKQISEHESYDVVTAPPRSGTLT